MGCMAAHLIVMFPVLVLVTGKTGHLIVTTDMKPDVRMAMAQLMRYLLVMKLDMQFAMEGTVGVWVVKKVHIPDVMLDEMNLRFATTTDIQFVVPDEMEVVTKMNIQMVVEMTLLVAANPGTEGLMMDMSVQKHAIK